MPDLTLILLAGLLVVMIFFTWRSSRKRKADAEQMQSKLVPGAEVMTQHGIFGELISIDEDTNQAIIETTPGTRLRVHRQTLSRVVEPTDSETAGDELVADEPADDAVVDEAAVEASEPEFGERIEKPKRASRQKPSETPE